jgi:putative phage-type endonuclease
MTLTPQQKEWRLDHITGSDVGTICGVNPWGNVIELWQEKLRLREPIDISDNPRVKAGIYLEPVVAKWFEDETGKSVFEDKESLIHKDYQYMGAHIDRRVKDESAILECKTAGYADGWGQQGEFLIPDQYLCQIAHYVAVCDVERAYLAVLIGGNDFRWYTYERNLKLEKNIIEKIKVFWNCVQKEIAPEPRTPEEVIALFSQAGELDSLIANEEIENAIQIIKDSRKQVKELEVIQEANELKVKKYMRGHDMLLANSGQKLVTWRNRKGQERFDSYTFKEEHPEVYKRYLVTGMPTRTFIIQK